MTWRTAPSDLALAPAAVAVWRVALVQPPAVMDALAGTLDADERDRAARFHFARDRAAYTVARGALRTLAARYLGCAAAAIGFGYRAKGKPFLAAPAGMLPGEPGFDLRFNVSHSDEVGLVCFARGCEVGVDVERRRALDDLLSLARISFSADEYARLCQFAPDDRAAAFFACWSRKEAFIKLTGEGVSQLADFDVSLDPGAPARLLRVAGEPPGTPRWSLHDLPEIAGYAAALAVEGEPARIESWEFAPGP
jgi:4'-phosphopantetheinyl transferase